MSSTTCAPKKQRADEVKAWPHSLLRCIHLVTVCLTPPFAHGSRSPLEKIMLLAVERTEHGGHSSLETRTQVQIHTAYGSTHHHPRIGFWASLVVEPQPSVWSSTAHGLPQWRPREETCPSHCCSRSTDRSLCMPATTTEAGEVSAWSTVWRLSTIGTWAVFLLSDWNSVRQKMKNKKIDDSESL